MRDLIISYFQRHHNPMVRIPILARELGQRESAVQATADAMVADGALVGTGGWYSLPKEG